MRYDFNRIIDRKGTNSVKCNNNTEFFGTEDVLDMWVADMDLACPEPVLDALRRRLEHPILGYTFAPDSLYQAVIDRMDRYYGWKVERDWIVYTPGVVTAVYSSVQAVSEVGDEILLQSPVYYPFFRAVTNTGRQVVENPLRLEGDRYLMDFEQLEESFRVVEGFGGKTHRIKGLVLCSPHNPVGRVWTVEELRRLGDICLANGCVIISDEIHADLLPFGAKHTPIASLSPELAQSTMTLMAPSKSFNLAGLEASFAIIPDPELRRRFVAARVGQSGVNLLGLVAMEAALREGDDYLVQLNEHLAANFRLFAEGLSEIPGVRLTPVEGTYLAWVDMRELCREKGFVKKGGAIDDQALKDLMFHKARIATDPGTIFGSGGEGFQRFNLACPGSVVAEAVERLKVAAKG